MSSPTAAPNVPIEFWTDVLEKEIDDSLAEFKKHADHISRSAYLGDFSNSLISFGMRQVCSSKLALSVIKLFEEEVNIQSLNGKAIENLIFFIDNDPAREALVRGASSAADSSRYVHACRVLCAAEAVAPW